MQRRSNLGKLALAAFLVCASVSLSRSDSLPASVSVKNGIGAGRITATFSGLTDRYPHHILGRITGWTSLEVSVARCTGCPAGGRAGRLELPAAQVFEDVTPRLWDMTGDGRPEVVVVQSDATKGSRLTVWEIADTSTDPLLTLRAATDYIGTRFRWLAPLGSADFNGDGVPDIALVDRPHRDRVLRIVTVQGDRLVDIARLDGVTNHAIGDERISGGVRLCDGGPIALVASQDWTRLVGVSVMAGKVLRRDLGPLPETFRQGALPGCPG
jgi:hypothetical protein